MLIQVGEGDYSFSAENDLMETITTSNTITSQYGIGEGAEFSLGAVTGVTEDSQDGDDDATALNQVKPILQL